MSDGGAAASAAVSRVALNMTLCASAAGMTSLVVASLQSGTTGAYDSDPPQAAGGGV